MRLPARRFTHAALLAALLSLRASNSFACTCAGAPAEVAVERAAHIFAGRVTERLSPSDEDRVRARGSAESFLSIDMVRWTLAPTASWKGAVADTLYIYSAAEGASCGYTFVVGEEYLVFAFDHSKGGGIRVAYAGGAALPVTVTGLCSGTAPLQRATPALAFLGPPRWERNEQ